jgi:hypothetical protein
MPLGTVTPDQLTAVLSAVAAVVSAVGGATYLIIKAIGTTRREVGEVMVKTKSIERATNGHAAAMDATKRALEEKVEGLERQLVESLASKLAAALVAEQAATDVRAERAATAPPDEAKGT